MVRLGLTVGVAIGILVFIAAASYAPPTTQTRRRSTYFKPNALRADPEMDVLYDAFLSSQLERMHLPSSSDATQPSLYMRPNSPAKHDQEYRAIISQGREYVIAIRAYHDAAGGAEVVANKVNIATGERQDLKRQLNGEEWGDILHNIDKAGLFKPHKGATYAGDCPDWVIESREGDRYDMMAFSCSDDPGVKALQAGFQRAAGWWAY